MPTLRFLDGVGTHNTYTEHGIIATNGTVDVGYTATLNVTDNLLVVGGTLTLHQDTGSVATLPELWIRGEGFPKDHGFDSIGLRRLSAQIWFRRTPSMAVDITALYCCLDDFCKVFEDWKLTGCSRRSTQGSAPASCHAPRCCSSWCCFTSRRSKHFKAFYRYGIGHQHRTCFGDLPHYDRFVSLMPRLFVPLMVLLHSLSGEQTGVYFADLTKLAVCHNRRIDRHKVFDGLAARGKTSMGWFFGLKLDFVINHKGQIMALKITPGNTADSAVLNEITQHLDGQTLRRQGLYRP